MQKLSFGFDVGIASVGWAVVNSETKQIIERGVRLFRTVDNDKDSKLKNEVRREKRSIRRQLSRRKTRKRDFVKFLIRHKLIEGQIDLKNQFVQKFVRDYIVQKKRTSEEGALGYIYTLRKQAMQQKLPFKQQLQVLFFYLSKRGFTYDVTVDEKESKKIQAERAEYQNLLPIDAQFKYFQKNGYLKGSFNRTLTHEDWLREVNQFLEIQQLDPQLQMRFRAIYESRRSFEEGPAQGNINAQSNFGLYRWENDQPTKPYKNIWDATTGVCSVYNGKNGRERELRAIKELHSAQLFNLLNDLNNMTFNNQKLTAPEKRSVIELLTSYTFKNKIYRAAQFSFQKLLKTLNLPNDEHLVSGSRINKKGQKIITRLTTFHELNKAFLMSELEPLTWENDRLQIDQIVEVLSSSKEVIKRQNYLKSAPQLQQYNYSKTLINNLANIKNKYSNTHSLSLKAISEMLPVLISENLNQMQIIYQNYGHATQRFEFKANQKNLPIAWIEAEVGAPTVRKSLRQTIYVINALLKKYRDPALFAVDHIFVEMTRESNNASKRENENNRQKYRKKKRDNIKAFLTENNIQYPSATLVQKIWLYEQQCGKDAYTGQALKIQKIIHEQNYVDIDHIVPYSQSYDNSATNKVLTLQQVNSNKGQKTPKQFLSPIEFTKMRALWATWTGAEGVVLPPDKKVFRSEKKYQYLTTGLDFKDPNNQIGFIGRNLTDTSYVAKTFLDFLTEFFKSKNSKVKVIPINGKMTSFARYAMINKKLGHDLTRPTNLDHEQFLNIDPKTGKKSRAWHGHHSEDATIICLLGLDSYQLHKYIEKALSNPWFAKNVLKRQTEDLLTETKKTNVKIDFDHMRTELNRTVNNVRFSRMKNVQNNVQFHHETLYGAKRESATQIHQISKKNLLEMSKQDCEKYFVPTSKDAERVLLKSGDKTTYQQLCDIFASYSDQPKPFSAALNDPKGLNQEQSNDSKENFIYVISPKTGAKIYIKDIKIKGALKDIKAVHLVDSSQTSLSFHDTFNWTRVQLFKNAKDQYVIVPLNIKMIYLPIKNNLIKYKRYYYEYLKSKNILEPKPIWTFTHGQYFRNAEGDLYYLVGSPRPYKVLEVEPLNHVGQKRNRWTLNTKMKNWDVINVDLLGNVYKQGKL